MKGFCKIELDPKTVEGLLKLGSGASITHIERDFSRGVWVVYISAPISESISFVPSVFGPLKVVVTPVGSDARLSFTSF